MVLNGFKVSTKGNNVVSSVLMENEELQHNKAINMVELAINGNVFTQQRSQGMAAWLNRMAPN